MTICIIRGIVVYLSLIVNSTICFGQFKEQSPREGQLKGKIASVVFANYNILINGKKETKEFNDRVAYLYDSKGLLQEEHLSDEEGIDSKQFRSVYTYNVEGNLSSLINYNQENIITERETYTFDPIKRLVVVNNEDTVKTKMQLDKAGNIMETTIYHGYPTPFSTFRYKYNAKGLCSEVLQSWSKSGDLHKTVYVYDANGNLIKETAYKNARVLSVYTYTYSKFDQFKNWLVQKTYSRGRLDGISERVISYEQ
jgi:uncharacterized protein RhaS with RHS repeats